MVAQKLYEISTRHGGRVSIGKDGFKIAAGCIDEPNTRFTCEKLHLRIAVTINLRQNRRIDKKRVTSTVIVEKTQRNRPAIISRYRRCILAESHTRTAASAANFVVNHTFADFGQRVVLKKFLPLCRQEKVLLNIAVNRVRSADKLLLQNPIYTGGAVIIRAGRDSQTQAGILVIIKNRRVFQKQTSIR